MESNPRQITSADLFFFLCPKSFNKPFEILLYKTNRLRFSVRVYYNRSHDTACKEQQSRHSTSSCVVLFVLYTYVDLRKNQNLSPVFVYSTSECNIDKDTDTVINNYNMHYIEEESFATKSPINYVSKNQLVRGLLQTLPSDSLS